VTIILPLPPKALHPNARPHWRTKAKHTREYRSEAVLGVRTSVWGNLRPKWGAAICQAIFYVKDARKRDRDNLLASLKSAFDGLADAGLIADDSGLTHLPVMVMVDKANPRVELHVTEAPIIAAQPKGGGGR
jgi:crossover junction endodeoxyribonuclease RusA